MRKDHDPIKALQQTQIRRARRERDVGIGDLVRSTARSAQHTRKQFGELLTVWEHLVPPEIVRSSRLHRLRGTTLEVLVESAPVMYQLDRLLRAGLTEEIRRAYRKGALNRIRLRLGSLDVADESSRDRERSRREGESLE